MPAPGQHGASSVDGPVALKVIPASLVDDLVSSWIDVDDYWRVAAGWSQ
jgi:hypothetical protein